LTFYLDVNVPSKSNGRKNCVKNLKVNDENSRIRIQDLDPDPKPDPLARSMDPRIRIRIPPQNVMDPEHCSKVVCNEKRGGFTVIPH
jgi:hypothetical protein